MSNSKDTGGPAFPKGYSQHPGNGEMDFASDGMSLRDYFAAKAMQAIRSRNPRVFDATRTPKHVRYLTAEETAKMAYEDADAMLAERKNKEVKG
jgi:hypothetical protein